MFRWLLLLLLLPAPASAQVVRGTILDPTTGTLLDGVNVRVLDRNGRFLYAAVSDSSGNFELPVPPGFAVRLDFQRIGYLRATSEQLVLRPGEGLDLEVQLVASAAPLQPDPGTRVVGRSAAARALPAHGPRLDRLIAPRD